MTGTPPGFIERFLAVVSDRPAAIAFESLENGQSWSYAELLGRMERWRAVFERAGVGEGDRILLLLSSGVDFIAAFFAIVSLQAVALPVTPQLTRFELEGILKARPRGAVTERAFPDELRAALGELECLRYQLTDEAVAGSSQTSPLAPPEGNPEVTCHATYKGLGYPLGALHRYDDYGIWLEGMRSWQWLESEAPYLICLPLQPVFGLTGSVLLPLTAGCRLVWPGSGASSRLGSLLEQHHIRYGCLVPPLLRLLVREARKRRPELHPELLLVSGASYLTPKLAGEVEQALGVEVLQGYGLTEVLPVTLNRPGANRPGTLGVPIAPATELAVVDAGGQSVAPGQAGEIVVRGPTLMSRYLGMPRETARFLKDGWFHTGDLGYLDEAGHLCFIDRQQPFTKISAQMVDLVEVETVLKLHPAVADARVTVEMGPKERKQLSASLILLKQAEVRISELLAHCRLKLSPPKRPRRIKVFRRHLSPLSADY